MSPGPEARRRIQRIWSTVRDIPSGCVASYGQVADITGIRRGARQVGYALRQLPPGHDVPWHRVITASGNFAFAEGSDQFKEQAKRLMMENVAVRAGKVNMKQYRWRPDLDELLWKPTDAWDENLE